MSRLTASRMVRLMVGAAILYMIVNFATRYMFTSPDRSIHGQGSLNDANSGFRRQHVHQMGVFPAPDSRPSPRLSRDHEYTKFMSIQERKEQVAYMARHLDVKYEVTNNLIDDKKYIGRITFNNTGNKPIKYGPWKIYFYHPVDIENVRQHEIGAELANRMMFVAHVNGGLFYLQPTSLFRTLQPGRTLVIPFEGGRWICSKTDVYPNWYVSSRGVQASVIVSTRGESLSFVGNFDSEALWKKNSGDSNNPFTPRQRFMRNEIEDMGKPGGIIVPTPLQIVPGKGADVKVDPDSWVIVGSTEVLNEVSYLTEKTGMKAVQFQPKEKFISLAHGEVRLPGADVVMEGAYNLSVQPDTQSVSIVGTGPAGVFYAIQSLLSLLENTGTLPVIKVLDAPRYKFRGFMLDVGRNFRTKEEVMEMIDLMSMYKMNKFHFHLTEDEGWRIHIPGLPELVQVGGKRCHDLKEEKCLLPYNGAGPEGKSDGYYTVSQYKEILAYAHKRHVQVIPEIDLPGHAHAAIKAMQLRYKNLMHRGQVNEAKKYLLSDPEDQSLYHSVQQFKDNVINVCMPSTYTFFEHVLEALIDMHKDIQPLKTFHVGGDEVPHSALMQSPKCRAFMEKNMYTSQANITSYFTRRVMQLTQKHNVAVQGWEDVFYKNHVLQRFKHLSTPVVNVWANVWTSSNVYRAHHLANNNYQVVLGPATHLYLDHPHEPDPDERGLFWATRFVDTYKVFGFMPDSYYDNIDVDNSGHPLSKFEVCSETPNLCPKLLKPENIIGLEGHLWGETVRTKEHFHMMVFPRLLALAERAWHRANWELEANANARRRRKNEDWSKFANTLGYHELPRLERRGIMYHIPLPGVIIEDGQLKMNSAIPGLPFLASNDNGLTWTKLKTNNRISGKMLLATSSQDGRRRSRSIKINV